MFFSKPKQNKKPPQDGEKPGQFHPTKFCTEEYRDLAAEQCPMSCFTVNRRGVIPNWKTGKCFTREREEMTNYNGDKTLGGGLED